MMSFWKFIVNQATETEPESVELRIEGDIVDDDEIWIYEWFGEKATAPNAFKEELSQFKGKDITVWIDSYGGSVFAAAGIYNALKEHNGKVTVKIDGKAMSAASVIAMAGDEVLMSPMAVMMIHNPLTAAYGNMHDLRKVADILDTIKESIVNAYALKTGRSRSKISQMMDDETWMSANVAVKEGFADGILYQDQPLDVANMSQFAFNRLAIVNSAKESIKSLLRFNGIKMSNNNQSQNYASSPRFIVGDRVEVLSPHEEGHATGEVREAVLTWTYGIVFDGMEDMGIHHWYVESELQPAEQSGNDGNDDMNGNDGMTNKKKKKKKQHDMPGMESDNRIEKEKLLLELDLI